MLPCYYRPMRERTPLRGPLFESGDPRRFHTINVGGPLTDHYFEQLKPTEKSQIINGVPHKEIVGTEPSRDIPLTQPLEITLVEMPNVGELTHTPHLIKPQEPKPLP